MPERQHLDVAQRPDVAQRADGPPMRSLLAVVAVVVLLHWRLMIAVEDVRRDAAHPVRLSSRLKARMVTLIAPPATPTKEGETMVEPREERETTVEPRAAFDTAPDARNSRARTGSMSSTATVGPRLVPRIAAAVPRRPRTPAASKTSSSSDGGPRTESAQSNPRPGSATEPIAGPPPEGRSFTPQTALALVDPGIDRSTRNSPAGSAEAPFEAVDAEPPPTASPSTSVQGREMQAKAARTAAASEAPDAQPGMPTPTYPTRPPPAATLKFSVRRAQGLGTAELVWRPQAEGYALTLEASSADGWRLAMVSRGAFDAAGLAPDRFTDRRARRSTLATNFRRATAQVSFSASPRLLALREGEQDRLSWLVQLAAIAAADPAFGVAGARIALPVAGLRGESEVWTFVVMGTEKVSTSLHSVPALRLHRAGPGGYETDVDVWLDPARNHLPVRVAWSNGVAAQALELLLQEVTIEP